MLYSGNLQQHFLVIQTPSTLYIMYWVILVLASLVILVVLQLDINSALAHYDAAWRDDECETCAAPPYPMYMEETGDDDSKSKDTCYHLLKLYCNGGYSLDELLLTAGNTSDSLDYHMR